MDDSSIEAAYVGKGRGWKRVRWAVVWRVWGVEVGKRPFALALHGAKAIFKASLWRVEGPPDISEDTNPTKD